MNLEKLFVEYKKISEDIIGLLEKNDFDNINVFFDKRQVILDQISFLGEEENKIKELHSKYNLFEVDQLMKSKFEIKKNEIKNNLSAIKKHKKANVGYNNLNSRAVFLSKEI